MPNTLRRGPADGGVSLAGAQEGDEMMKARARLKGLVSKATARAAAARIRARHAGRLRAACPTRRGEADAARDSPMQRAPGHLRTLQQTERYCAAMS